MSRPLDIVDAGVLDYAAGRKLQAETVERVLGGETETLILCEHPAVFTVGRMDKKNNFLADRRDILARGIAIVPVDRGGEVTLHAPGQLVVYPILRLKDRGLGLKEYLQMLEETAMAVLEEYGLCPERSEGRTGVWAENKKIASIGIGVRKWVSFHGIGINLNTDLELFRLIRPCGLDVHMASAASLTGRPVDMNEAKSKLIEHFCRLFGSNVIK